MKNNKGFTLIELLVVIAIIGILSSIVLASLSSARDKAQAAAFKSEMSSLLPSVIIDCEDGTGTQVPDGSTHSSTATPACDAGGSWTAFSIAADNGITCSASIAETGITYTGADC